MIISEAIKTARQQLRQSSSSPQLDAELLLAFSLKKSRSYLFAWPEQVISETELQFFLALLARRLQREPLAYITGTREFWSLDFNVNQHTLIPRPETECLVIEVLKTFAERSTVKLADLGTGSGAIALALAHEKPGWEIVATDVNEKTLAVAKQNAAQLKISQVRFHQGYWCRALTTMDFDVIVSNPPYIGMHEWPQYATQLAYEPRSALLADEDGLAAIREICAQASTHLKSTGYLFIEHGFAQGPQVREIFMQKGYIGVYTVRDVEGHERVTVGRVCARDNCAK